jgi:hypothetical protein
LCPTQVKALTRGERVRTALLVSALASRDAGLLRATARELGVRIEKCGEDFEAVST